MRWRQVTNERPPHASIKATFDVARGPDVTPERIIPPPLLRSSQAFLPSSPGFGAGAEPSRGPRPTNRSGTAWNNVADRVGEFPPLRLSLPSRCEETGRTGQSQSRGETALVPEEIIHSLVHTDCEYWVMGLSLLSTFDN